MNERALRSIIIEGQKRHSKQVEFSSEVVDRIVSLSSGYAHFTHLLTLKCAEDAIGNNTKNISLKDLEIAMSRAVDDVEGSLKKVYNDATRSANTLEYKKIVFAAANCLDEFPAADLRSKYEELYQVVITQQTLNNYFKRLVGDDNTSILRRLAKGVYRFNDPRMPSYVRIAHQYDIT